MMMYLLTVIARIVKTETAINTYLIGGWMWHRSLPWVHARFQKVTPVKDGVIQQNNRSEKDKFIMNIAVAL